MAKRTWAQEKAYRAKRAGQAIVEMEQAISNYDKERFQAAWQVAMMYMNGKQRKPYYIRMMQRGLEIKKGALENV